jgi:uncharacterized protein YkwD
MRPLPPLLLSLALLASTPAACASSPIAAADVQRTEAIDRALQTPVDPAAFQPATLQIALFHATNAARARHGVPALAYDRRLALAAQLHAERMIALNFLSHTDPHDASLASPSDRARKMGIPNPYLAENLATQTVIDYRAGANVYPRGARGKFSYTPDGPILPLRTYEQLAQALVEQWMNSPGHRKNLLAKDALQLGCGAALTWQGDFPTVYAVQNFQLYEQAK